MYCTNCGMKFEGKFCPVCGQAAYEINDDYISAQKRVNTPNTINTSPINAVNLRSDNSVPTDANIKRNDDENSGLGSKYVSDKQFYSPLNTNPTALPPETSVMPPPKPTSEPKRTSPFFVIFALIAAAAFLFLLIGPSFLMEEPEKDAPYIASPTPAPYKAITFPNSGHSVVHNGEARKAPFIVNLPSGDSYYYLVLADSVTNRKEVSIYAHSGDTVEIEVPLGKYFLYYTSGDTWYGNIPKFGDDASFYKADAVLEFYETSDAVYYEEITLYPVANGNMDTEYIDSSEFPV